MEDDYMSFVKEHIELDKILYNAKPENREILKKLLEEKKKIIHKNGLFANFQLNRINKKINKYLN